MARVKKINSLRAFRLNEARKKKRALALEKAVAWDNAVQHTVEKTLKAIIEKVIDEEEESREIEIEAIHELVDLTRTDVDEKEEAAVSSILWTRDANTRRKGTLGE